MPFTALSARKALQFFNLDPPSCNICGLHQCSCTLLVVSQHDSKSDRRPPFAPYLEQAATKTFLGISSQKRTSTYVLAFVDYVSYKCPPTSSYYSASNKLCCSLRCRCSLDLSFPITLAVATFLLTTHHTHLKMQPILVKTSIARHIPNRNHCRACVANAVRRHSRRATGESQGHSFQWVVL